jgi:hypothetical protein
MRTSGVKLLDPVLEHLQIEWLLVTADECRDIQAEECFISRYFRKPHEPWGASGAYVSPVRIRRSRRRVLFWQQSGLE